jgi:cytochrome c553
MPRVKFFIILVFFIIFLLACDHAAPPAGIPLSENKSYEASLFRQNCAICHGQDANGKTLDDGKAIPSLRQGEFKFRTSEQIYNQIANGGNGMLPFRDQLSDREIRQLVEFVQNDLRKTQ